jgi:hypothetical protein
MMNDELRILNYFYHFIPVGFAGGDSDPSF